MTLRHALLRFRCLLCAAVLVVACTDAPQDGVNHPLPEALAEMRRDATATLLPDTVPSSDMSSDARADWTNLRRDILSARPGKIIGVVDGNGVDVIGELTAVVISASDEIHVLDGRNGRVIVFDANGSITDWFGRIGDGPTEFRMPAPVLVTGDTLFVAQMGAVKMFVRGVEGYEWHGHAEIETTMPFSMCASGERIFIGGHREPEGMIRQYRPAVGPAFGSGYLFGSPRMQSALSQGVIMCEKEAAIVVYGHRDTPSLVGYTFDGERAWSTTISEYVQGYWLEIGQLRGAPVAPRETLSRARDHRRSVSARIVLPRTDDR